MPSNYSRICSSHFKEDDKYTTKTGRVYLKKSAVPCDIVSIFFSYENFSYCGILTLLVPFVTADWFLLCYDFTSSLNIMINSFNFFQSTKFNETEEPEPLSD